jgi:hypothetical protein
MAKMTNREHMPKQTFAGKLKKAKNITPTGSPLNHQVKGHYDVFFLTTAHENVHVEAPSSRGAHLKLKLAAVLDYKYGVERSDQMLSHYSFEGRQ